nr:hypothetical protein [Halosimplex rubrum]
MFNLVVMAGGAWLAYQEPPPIPENVVGPDGETVMTGTDIREGEKAFQRDGLMNHGSILSNGAYYGADYTADTLDLKVERMRDYYAGERYGGEYGDLDSAQQAAVGDVVESDLDEGYGGGAIQCSAAEMYAHEQIRGEYGKRFVLRSTADDPAVDDTAVAEGVLDDD